MSRLHTGGIAHISRLIEEDIRSRKLKLHSSKIEAMSDIAASILSARTVNTTELSSILPRDANQESNYRYINRFLSSRLVTVDEVMKLFICELVKKSDGQIAIIALDQSKMSDGFECLMLSLRVGKRAVPLLWRIVETKGAIGFNIQKELLDSLFKIITDNNCDNGSLILMADRFYGTSALVDWCKDHKWQYRIRLKGNINFNHQGGEINSSDAIKLNMDSLENATFINTNISTNIGIIYEEGHKEPWFIAMDTKPSKYKTLDYSMRWGIESMFSDIKSRGFKITKTQLKHTDRIERLILVVAIALFWAVSTGMSDNTPPPKSKKNFIDQLLHSLLLD